MLNSLIMMEIIIISSSHLKLHYWYIYYVSYLTDPFETKRNKT